MFNFYLRELSAVTILLAIVFAAFHLENDDLVTFYKGVHYLYYYFRTFNGGCAYGYCSFFVYKQYLVKLNSFAGLHIFNVVNIEFHTLFYLKLLTVNFYNCVHYNVCKTVFREAFRLVPTLF